MSKIQHMVIFNLKHPKKSDETLKFLADGKNILTQIPVVENFKVLNQVSPKNHYNFGFSMVFTCENDYKAYNEHPFHVSFVNDRWQKEVSEFLEIDFETEGEGTISI